MPNAIDCRRKRFLQKLIGLFLGAFLPLFGQVVPTTIVGPVYDAFGNPYTGSFTVQSQVKTTTGYAITGTTRVVYVTAGVIQAFTLVPNDTSTPNLTSYSVQFANADRWICIVPTVPGPYAKTISTTAGSKTVTVNNTTNLAVNQLLSATGIPTNSVITNVNGTTVTLNNAATATNASISGTFYVTVPYTQVCSPNATPPNQSLPISPSQILPYTSNGYFIGTVNGTAQWVPAPSTTPGGSSGQVQYNNNGTFGGFTVSGDGTLNTNTGALTVTKTNGVSFAASATTDTTNASNISTGTLGYARLPLFTSTTAGAVSGSGGGTTTFLRADGTWATPPGQNPGGITGQLQYNTGTGFGGVTVGGDGTLNTSTGVLTVTKTNGTAFAPSATVDTTNASNITSGVLGSSQGGAGLVSGILKANGSGVVSAAVAGTDYLTPTGNGSGLTNLTPGNISSGTAGISITGNATTASSVNFSGVAAGTNTNALVIGNGGSLSATGTGTISATTSSKVNNTSITGTVGQVLTTNGSGGFGTSITLATVATTGSYNDLSNKPSIPTVTGGTCTNQVVTAISNSAVPTCTTITSAYVNNSIALTGVDINTSNQVTATHLSSALPIAQGGTGSTAISSGLVKSNGTALSTATAGTDYAPATNGTIGQALTSNGAGGFGTALTLAASATTDTTNASNISSGTLGYARLPLFTSTTAGAVSGSGGGTTNFLRADGTWAAPTSSGGTVTSVGLSLPSIFTVTNSPVISSGTLTATFNSQTASTFFAAPSGASGTPTFRAIVASDIPTLNQNTTGTASNVTGVVAVANGGTGTSLTLTGLIRGSATAFTASEISGDCTTSGSNAITCTKTNGTLFAASATTDTTNASNISSGTLPAARLPLFTSIANGAVSASGGGTTNFLRADGTWAAPPTSSPGGTTGQVQYNTGTGFGGFTVSGDGTLVTSTGVLTVTKTNGVSFAASATTDTTNASNISSGTLNAARLPTTVVLNNQANTYTTGLQDFSSATFKVPTAAGFTATATSMFGFDSTNKNYHVYAGSADSVVAPFITTPTSGNCVSASVSGGVVKLVDAGGPCTTGGGGGTVSGGVAGQIAYYASTGNTVSGLNTVPISAGGTGTSSTLTGIVRGGASAFTASEISGDCTTSGSNAITCTKTNGTLFAASATTDTTNASNISSGTLPAARLPLFNSTTNGAVSASGGGTTNFLRADGTWAAPPSTSPGGTTGQIQYNNGSSFAGFTVSGDGTLVASTGVLTISKVNGTSIPTNSSADQVVLTTASATGSWASIPNCLDSSGQHLNYATSSHSFSCGTSVAPVPYYVTTQTSAYTVSVANGTPQFIKGNAATAGFTITLYTAVGYAGYTVTIKKVDATGNNITVATTASQTIDGSSTFTIAGPQNAFTFISDGTNWNVM